MKMYDGVRNLLNEHKNKDGMTIQHLLNDIAKKIVKENPKDLYDSFEDVISFIQDNKLIYKSPLSDEEVNSRKTIEKEYTKICKKYQCKIAPNNSLDFGQMQYLPDDMEHWKIAGYDIGDLDSILIQRKIEQLCLKDHIKRVRFWGKIKAKNNDYYILYGNSLKDFKEEERMGWEPRGQGVNSFTYWVTTDLLKEWTELPVVSAEQIQISRMIKVTFTGYPHKKITGTFPKFKGTEAHYLKCQIVRIDFSCQIAPLGVFTISENDDAIIELDPAYEFQQIEDLLTTENWCHVNPEIMKVGSAKHYAPHHLNEEERQDFLDTLNAKETPIERLRALSEDRQISEEVERWMIRKYGDHQIYNDVEDETVGHNYGVIIIKSLIWEGAFTLLIPSKKTWCFMYIGNGLKTDQIFIPKGPGEIMKDPKDCYDRSEPNPLNPPSEKLESDSDAPSEEEF